MAKLMWLLGIVQTALGAALALLTFYSPGKMLIYGLTTDTAAIMIAGGAICLGMGSMISALQHQISVQSAATKQQAVLDSSGNPIPGYGRRSTDKVVAPAAIATVGAATALGKGSDASKTSVADTISALEQAKSDIKTALGGMDSMTSPREQSAPVPFSVLKPQAAAAVPPAPAAAVVESAAEDELFVVEEKIIRGRPSRILSDDTVEAETDEGWMRFENLEHLNEYLDSLEVEET